MVNFKAVASGFIVLTIIFAASTAYLAAYPSTTTTTATSTQVSTMTQTSTQVSTVTQTSTQVSTMTQTSTQVSTVTVSAAAPPAYSVNIAYKQGIGYYLTNGTGFALYLFSADTPGNGTSTCNGSCATAWPPFYAGSMSLPSGLNSSSFSTITRADGSMQTTYNGWPLYYFVRDSSAGSTVGEGIYHFGGMWYAIPPTMQQSGGQIIGGPSYSLGVAYKASIGVYLTNSAGMTLYFRSTDTPNSNSTTCTSTVCETNWPAFYAPSLSLPPGVSSASFATITPYNSTSIVTYDGYALFTWIHDSAPGDTTGQGIGGFYVATLPTPMAPPSTVTSTTSTTTT